jgi:hypothetical protein
MPIHIILIYIISIAIQSAIDIAIENHCPNIKLTSPVYFTKDVTCRIQFPQQVDSKSRVDVNIKTGMARDTFGGILLYHIEGKEDTSISTQLFVIWGCKIDRIYSHTWIYLHTWLVEYEYTLTWNEDRLKQLHDVYSSQYEVYFDTQEWLLNDNTMLKTECETSYGGPKMEVSIFEKEDLTHLVTPLWIDSER